MQIHLFLKKLKQTNTITSLTLTMLGVSATLLCCMYFLNAKFNFFQFDGIKSIYTSLEQLYKTQNQKYQPEVKKMDSNWVNAATVFFDPTEHRLQSAYPEWTFSQHLKALKTFDITDYYLLSITSLLLFSWIFSIGLLCTITNSRARRIVMLGFVLSSVSFLIVGYAILIKYTENHNVGTYCQYANKTYSTTELALKGYNTNNFLVAQTKKSGLAYEFRPYVNSGTLNSNLVNANEITLESQKLTSNNKEIFLCKAPENLQPTAEKKISVIEELTNVYSTKHLQPQAHQKIADVVVSPNWNELKLKQGEFVELIRLNNGFDPAKYQQNLKNQLVLGSKADISNSIPYSLVGDHEYWIPARSPTLSEDASSLFLSLFPLFNPGLNIQTEINNLSYTFFKVFTPQELLEYREMFTHKHQLQLKLNKNVIEAKQNCVALVASKPNEATQVMICWFALDTLYGIKLVPLPIPKELVINAATSPLWYPLSSPTSKNINLTNFKLFNHTEITEFKKYFNKNAATYSSWEPQNIIKKITNNFKHKTLNFDVWAPQSNIKNKTINFNNINILKYDSNALKIQNYALQNVNRQLAIGQTYVETILNQPCNQIKLTNENFRLFQLPHQMEFWVSKAAQTNFIEQPHPKINAPLLKTPSKPDFNSLFYSLGVVKAGNSILWPAYLIVFVCLFITPMYTIITSAPHFNTDVTSKAQLTKFNYIKQLWIATKASKKTVRFQLREINWMHGGAGLLEYLALEWEPRPKTFLYKKLNLNAYSWIHAWSKVSQKEIPITFLVICGLFGFYLMPNTFILTRLLNFTLLTVLCVWYTGVKHSNYFKSENFTRLLLKNATWLKAKTKIKTQATHVGLYIRSTKFVLASSGSIAFVTLLLHLESISKFYNYNFIFCLFGYSTFCFLLFSVISFYYYNFANKYVQYTHKFYTIHITPVWIENIHFLFSYQLWVASVFNVFYLWCTLKPTIIIFNYFDVGGYVLRCTLIVLALFFCCSYHFFFGGSANAKTPEKPVNLNNSHTAPSHEGFIARLFMYVCYCGYLYLFFCIVYVEFPNNTILNTFVFKTVVLASLVFYYFVFVVLYNYNAWEAERQCILIIFSLHFVLLSALNPNKIYEFIYLFVESKEMIVSFVAPNCFMFSATLWASLILKLWVIFFKNKTSRSINVYLLTILPLLLILVSSLHTFYNFSFGWRFIWAFILSLELFKLVWFSMRSFLVNTSVIQTWNLPFYRAFASASFKQLLFSFTFASYLTTAIVSVFWPIYGISILAILNLCIVLQHCVGWLAFSSISAAVRSDNLFDAKGLFQSTRFLSYITVTFFFFAFVFLLLIAFLILSTTQ